MPRQGQFAPRGGEVKYVLNSTSQRRDGGKSAIASTNSGRRSMPGWKTRNTGRFGSARNDSARTPAQPASPSQCLPGAGDARRPVVLRGPSALRQLRGSPSQVSCMNPGWLSSHAGPACGRSLASSTT